ncbi:hypothetical protein HK098_002969 [Nowakowskiella sp. JEL0407]|nr:hypothetical protein HK098_002969 [Nowakowskiella sp. JEL0407]
MLEASFIFKEPAFESSPVILPVLQDLSFNDFIKKTANSLLSKLSRSTKSTLFYLAATDGKWINSFDDLLVIVNSANANVYVMPVVLITGPKPLPFVGNIYDLLPDPATGLFKLFKIYGSVLKLNLLGEESVATNDPAVVEFMMKESEFMTKKMVGPMKEIKEIGGNGLFTTNTNEPDWTLAHNLLMPAFSPKAMKAYTTEMGEIGQKLVTVFDKIAANPIAEHRVADISRWMTNATFETIGHIGFGYNFGLLDSIDAPIHPFIQAMAFCLQEAASRSRRPAIASRLAFSQNRRFEREMKMMKDTVDEVITARKASPDANNIEKDLLGFMLNAKEEDSGKQLSDSLIRDEVITFLIAGHETTSNTLSWLLYELYCNPAIEAKLLQELVDVLGTNLDELPTSAQVNQLKYLEQCIKEVLRIHQPVPGVIKSCKKSCVLPGGYQIEAGTTAIVSIYSLHHNEKVYNDPFTFDPERWIPSEESKRSTYSWLPFSIGPRGCIGRQFAMQEAKIIAAIILRKFKFILKTENVRHDPTQLTHRPVELHMEIVVRDDLPIPTTSPTKITNKPEILKKDTFVGRSNISLTGSEGFPPLDIIYGSNAGTAQDFATQIASASRNFGFTDVTMSTMDKWKGLQYLSGTSGITLDKNRRLLVVTATYNGQPPENADKFNSIVAKALVSATANNTYPLDGLRFTVFGCGNKQWKTYQNFPKLVDASLENLGGRRIFPRGEGNADEDIETDFQEWFNQFLAYLSEKFGISSSPPARLTGNPDPLTTGVEIKILPSTSPRYAEATFNKNMTALGQLSEFPEIVATKELQNVSKSKRSTRHIDLKVAEEMVYSAGDHFEVMPQNSDELVEKFANRLKLNLDSAFFVTSIEPNAQIGSRALASTISGPCTLRNALKYYADLLGPIPRTVFWMFSDNLKKDPKNSEIEAKFRNLANPGSKADYNEFTKKYRTVMDVLDAFPQIEKIEIIELLCGFQVMLPRRYSISSSPMVSKTMVSVSIGVVSDAVDSKSYPGLCSDYLARLEQGAVVNGTVRMCKDLAFRPPQDPKIPVIMVCAGTGISPFRGFLQDRRATGFKSVAKGGVSITSIYFGCRNEDDFIYKDELTGFLNDGTLDELNVAFSRPVDSKDKRYVQHLLLENAQKVWSTLHEKKGRLFVCGSASGMANDVVKAIEEIYIKCGGVKVKDVRELSSSLLQSETIVMDVWG